MSERSLGGTADLVVDVLTQDALGPDGRRTLVGLSDEEAARLAALRGRLALLWGNLADELVSALDEVPAEARPEGLRSGGATLRASLVGYLDDLCAGDYGEAWMAERARVGLEMAEAGFPADWLASAWGRVLASLSGALADDPESLAAVLRVAHLDLGATLHARGHLEREASARLRQFARTVLEGVPDGIVLTDPGGRIVFLNGAAEAMFDLPRQTACGQPFEALLHEANRPDEARMRREVFEVAPGAPGRAAATQMTGLRSDGTTVPLEVTFRAGALDGEPVCCAAVRDVSERQRAEQALRRSEANFRALIEGSPDAIVVHRAGKVVYANPAFLGLLELPDARAIVGQPVAALLPVPGLVSPEQAGVPQELRWRRGEREIVAEARAFALAFDGQPAIVLVVRDVTERHRLAARVLEMDRAIAVGNLAAAASHEINNPLTYVLGNTQFARTEVRRLAERLRAGEPGLRPEDAADRLDELARALDEAQEGAARVRETVASLRGLVRREPTLPGPVRLDTVVDDAVAIAWTEIRHRAQLERRYLGVRSVEGSEQRLCQVFVHLLLNAAQAIPEGATVENEIAVTIEAEDDRAVVEVSDTGRGMSPEVLSRCFEPFFTTRRSGEAAGLGLSIARQIVEGAGGTISIRSVPEAGTRVRVVLPAAAEIERKPRHSGLITPVVPPGRVLLIDDEPSVASAFRRVVDEHHAVTSLTSARDALQRLRNGERWDVVFCDLHMPDLSGMQFHEALTSIEPGLAARTIFITGGAFTEEARAFLRSVPNPCLDKPFDAGRIARLLASALRNAA